jgi:hypothetical protein
MLEGHLIPFFGGHAIHEVEARPELIDAYVASKAADGLSPKTIQNHMLLLNVMLRRAVVWRLIRTNPVSSVDRPRLAQPEMSILTEVEIARLTARTTSSSPRPRTPSARGGNSRRRSS